MSRDRRRVLAIALAVALFAVVLPMALASAASPDDNTVRLAMANGAGSFTYKDGAGSTLTQSFTASKQCAPLVSGANVMALSAAPSNGAVGFATQGLGVKVPGEGNSGKCEQVNVPNQVLTLEIASTGPLNGKTFDFAELDIEAKFDASINIALFDGSTQVDADPLTESDVLVISCTSSGSDCGPDDAQRDNFRIRVPSGGEVVRFTKMQLWATSTGTSGAVTLEGGADGTAPEPGGIGASVGTSDTIFHVTPTVDLDVTKTADDASASAGDTIGYTVTVTNNGPGNAYAVELTDTLPTNEGTSWTIDSQDGDACTISTTPLCSIDMLAEDGSYSVHVTSPTTSATGTVTNSATASASNAPQELTGDVSIAVLGPGLSVTKTAEASTDGGATWSEASSATAGDRIGFAITVTNGSGAGNAYGVSLTDTLPTNAGTDWSIDAQDGTACEISSGALGCALATMAPGASYDVHISSLTTAETIADSPVDNTASVSSSNGGSGTDSASIEVWEGLLACPSIEEPGLPSSVSTGEEGPSVADLSRRENLIDPETGEPFPCEPKPFNFQSTIDTNDDNVIVFEPGPVPGQEQAHYFMTITWDGYDPMDITIENPATPATIAGRTILIQYSDTDTPHPGQLCTSVTYDDAGDPTSVVSATHPLRVDAGHVGAPEDWCITGQVVTIDVLGKAQLVQYWDGIGDPKWG